MINLLWNKSLRHFLLLVLLTPSFTRAQEQHIIKEIVERLAPTLPDDYDLSELTERLNYYRKHPVNLNHTSAEELKNFVFLSSLQISNLFAHILSNGKLLAIEELQVVDAFDLETISSLLPFVTLGEYPETEIPSFRDLRGRANQSLVFRYAQGLEKQKGYRDLPGSRYLGTPGKILIKYRYNYSDRFSASLVFKKDAGEEFFSGNNKYNFDFSSFSLGFNHLGRITKLVIGDYSLQFGQGLTLWSGFAFGKGPDVTSAAKKDLGLKAYTSSNESSFFRGVAAAIKVTRHIEFSPFISYKHVDASQSLLPNGEYGQVNISVSGLHRTRSEIKNKNSLGQLVYGSVLQYLSNNLNIGTIAYASHYENAFITGNRPYNALGFTGKDLLNVGLHYNYSFRNLYLFGERAQSPGGGAAMANGIMASLSHHLSAILLHRNYDLDYHSYFSQAIGENSDASNEKGWYTGLNYNIDKKWSASLYADIFHFPWLKYRVDAASSGYEAQGQLVYNPFKTFKLTARFKTKLDQQNTDSKVSLKYLEPVSKQNWRLETYWRLNRKISFQNRMESCRYQKGEGIAENGYLFCQDIDYKPLSSRLSGNLRLAYFHTDSYESRLYAYEDDVLNGFAFGMYNGKGLRSYLNLKYNLFRKFDLWTRYAIFIYQQTEAVGSGLDEIQGNIKSEFKIQLRYQF
ncbi:hypothetical protein DBR11_00005 [Pedobacter sp. HMWF019]|nr:helix-hairpin-helix domain-containing protein [Pedobacter sp. HMWF019]PTT04266.1 hypothetical protein DBR11_00005 [Pedobacter sp. HMWF019]